MAESTKKLFLQKVKTKNEKIRVKIICKNILFCVARHITWNLFVKLNAKPAI